MKTSSKFPGLQVARETYPNYSDNTVQTALRFTFGRLYRLYDISNGSICLLNPGRLKMTPAMIAHCEAYAQAVASKMKAAA